MEIVMKWLLARPLVTHTLLAALYTLIIAAVVDLFVVAHAPIIGALIVSTFFYGREAGQKEHDLKHEVPQPQPPWFLARLGNKYANIRAWLGAEFMLLWGLDNFSQWLVAAGSSAAVAAILTIAGR